jgi:cell fate regulator YaaT (PSP1 superfamily)
MTTHDVDQSQAVSNSVASVRFHDVGKLYDFGSEHMPDLRVGEYVIVETTRGRQLGQVAKLIRAGQDDQPRDYKPVLRKATPADMLSQKQWKARQPAALASCQEKADELGGFENAKFIEAQYNYDGTLLTFLFSAEEKVNPGKLRSVLQRSFRAKVEVRQIGPRDVAKVLGGMGACGIQRCCSVFLTDFSPISIKMAKAQGISLNPSEITGMCGRLRCCLLYEYEQYVEARKHLPKRKKRVGTPHGEGRVIDVHPLQDAVTVLIDDTRFIVQREDIIPMEEYEAFKAKAQGRHMPVTLDEPREYGPPKDDVEPDKTAPRNRSSRDKDAESDTGQHSQSGRSRRRRGKRRGRGRRRRKDRKNDSSSKNNRDRNK